MIYYSVCSSYYDNGKVIANIMSTMESDVKPLNQQCSSSRCDTYIDWFETKEAAQRCVEECRKESL